MKIFPEPGLGGCAHVTQGTGLEQLAVGQRDNVVAGHLKTIQIMNDHEYYQAKCLAQYDDQFAEFAGLDLV
ncbi:MAG: hypothetical protein MO846_10765 [Candidatus Devosia symbiotica]|nr:hypothetical protein [Candidatus Devosia symbiotica]